MAGWVAGALTAGVTPAALLLTRRLRDGLAQGQQLQELVSSKRNNIVLEYLYTKIRSSAPRLGALLGLAGDIKYT